MTFFIVWGRKFRGKVLGHTIWTCPSCGRTAPATIEERESAAHLYFIPLGYRYEGLFADCHWCDSHRPVDPDRYPLVGDVRWKPGDEPADLAAALDLKIDRGVFTAPPTAHQLLALWSGLRWRRFRLFSESIGRFSLSAGLIAAAAAAPPLTVLALVVGPPGKPIENLIMGMLGGVMMSFPMGLLFGNTVRVSIAQWGYMDRKLRQVLGEGMPLGPFKQILEKARRVMEPTGTQPGEARLTEADVAKIDGLLERLRPELDRAGIPAAPPEESRTELPYERSPEPPPESAPADGALVLFCPHCGKKLNVKARLQGKTVRCPACREPFEIGAPQRGGG